MLDRRSAHALALLLSASWPAAAQTQLLNVSYDPTRELYRDINAAFAKSWQAQSGETLTIRASHGGSGAQARSVIDGLAADVVTLALAPDIDAIARAGKLPETWQSRLPNNSVPYSSTVVFLVRKGNPKAITDWEDLARPGIQVITPNPKTSGGARWNYLAAWGYALGRWNSEDKARDFVAAIYRNAPVMDTGARGASVTFARRGLGDVLITWENEAFLISAEFGHDQFDLVAPSRSIVAEPPVALVDRNVDQKGTRKAAEAYLAFLYGPEAQRIIARHHYRPSRPDETSRAELERLPKLDLFRLEDVFGSWTEAQAKHFGPGGVFDSFARTGR
ncbi:sulfate ABC transporter substrate-binding protein [Enterovirga sp.]|uniref:sulfate ABC transporter substrate-binding protein n=1 Tax=Enterovirga sp. TaxID=2026350 RepID=UPI0026285393|nr:sulfate ABC transporter substrate-binding protein [Enterovirga sp.]MDB5591701.1 sulfate transporter subunit [Enterovirga sp.]